MKFEERVTNHRQTELETIESRSTFFGTGPKKNSGCRRGHQRDDSKNSKPIVDGQGNQQSRGPGELHVQVAVKQTKLWNHRGNQIGHDNGRNAEQQNGIDQRRENLFAHARAHSLIGNVVVQDTRQISALFARQDSRRVNFRKYTGFSDSLGKRLALPDPVPDLGDDRTEFGRCGSAGEKIQRFQDWQTCFDQRVELLIENEEFRTANLASTLLADQPGEAAATGFHRIDV